VAKVKKKSRQKLSVGIPEAKLLHAPTPSSEPKFSPSRRAETRERKRESKRPLSEVLLELAATHQPGRGKIGAAISGVIGRTERLDPRGIRLLEIHGSR